MSDPAIVQVEEMLKQRLQDYEPLAGWTVITDQSSDIAIQRERYPVIVISTAEYKVGPAMQQWETNHHATLDFEVISGKETVGVISRNNHIAVAHIIAAIAIDRGFGGKLQDIQEVDVAPAGPNGKDASATSLQFLAHFITSREDWFTIVPA